MSSKRRDQLELRSAALYLLLGLSWIVLIGGVIGLLNTKESYGYRGAERATVQKTGDCTTMISRRGTGGTRCAATWTVGGELVQGTATTYKGGRLPPSDTFVAKVYGTTARTSMDRGTYLWGLWAPWLVLATGLIVVAGTVMSRRITGELAGSVMDVDDARRLGLTPGNLHDPDEAPKLDDPEIQRAAEENRLGPVRFVQDHPTGVTIPLLILAVLVGLAIALPGLRIVFVVLAVLWAAAAAYGTYALRSSGESTVFFAEGVVDRIKDQLFAARYDQLEAAWVDTERSGDKSWARYRLRTKDGRELVLDHSRLGYVQLGERLIRDANDARLPRMQHRLSVGAQIPFGPLTATDDGLLAGAGLLPWESFADISIEGTDLVLRSGEQQVKVPVEQIPWAPSLVRIFDARRRRR